MRPGIGSPRSSWNPPPDSPRRLGPALALKPAAAPWTAPAPAPAPSPAQRGQSAQRRQAEPTPRLVQPARTPAITRDARDVRADRATLGTRLINLGAVLVPLAGLIAAIALAWGRAFDWTQLGLMGGFYLATAFGVTVGFHRLFTHRSFAAARPVQWAFAILGSMAVQGPLLKWVAQHRMHHQHSDEEGDPHSPNLYGRRWWQILRGFWHAHTGWLFERDASDLARYAGDLQKERGLRVINRLFVVWVAVSLLLPAILGGLLSGSWTGVLLGFIWGGLVRICLQHHITWSINSVCHLWGTKPFATDDQSRNNAVFGILAMGEGWHNNHHAFPNSARHGLRWWEVDASYLLIRLLKLAHLAWNIRVPGRPEIATKRSHPAPAPLAHAARRVASARG